MKIFEFNHNHEQASGLAQAVANQMRALLQHKPHITLAVSGGKSPIKFFEQLSRQDLAWDKVTITLVDERLIAATHSDSNENLVHQHLLINKAANAHFIGLATTDDPQNAVHNANLHLPSIDLAVLGMGEDGHTSSIFPDCPELEKALALDNPSLRYLITTPTAASYQRIGLGLAAILEIPHLFLSINGTNKRRTLHEAERTPTSHYPISYVLAARKDLEIYWSL